MTFSLDDGVALWGGWETMTRGQADMVRFVYVQGLTSGVYGGRVLSWSLSQRGISEWCSRRWGPSWGEGNQLAGLEILAAARVDP